MSKSSLFCLSIVAVALALALGFGTLDTAYAVKHSHYFSLNSVGATESGSAYILPAGQVNLVGYDAATNSVTKSD